jgi:hypothetical protein
MKKIYFMLIILAVALGLIGYYLGRMDNGPKENLPIDTSSIPNRFAE